MKSLSSKGLLFFLLVMAFWGLHPVSKVFGATVPRIASAIGQDLDMQTVERFGQDASLQGLSLSVTTPVDQNSLEESNVLARQMQEEITRWFVRAGYEVHEIRKGANVLFEPEQGELLLTRRQRLLGNTKINSKAIVGGTYTVTPLHVRFNIKIVATGNREVLAMSTMTVPIDAEIAALLKVNRGGGSRGGALIEPTVVTLLP